MVQEHRLAERCWLIAALPLLLALGACQQPASINWPNAQAIGLKAHDVPKDLTMCQQTDFANWKASDWPTYQKAGATQLSLLVFMNDLPLCSKDIVPSTLTQAGLVFPWRWASSVAIRFRDVTSATQAYRTFVWHGTDPKNGQEGYDTLTGAATGFGTLSQVEWIGFPGSPGFGMSASWQRGPYILRFDSGNLTAAEGEAAMTAMSRRVPVAWAPCADSQLAPGCHGSSGVGGKVTGDTCLLLKPPCSVGPVAAILYVTAQSVPTPELAQPIADRPVGPDGAFDLALPPGSYFLGAKSAFGSTEQQITVQTGKRVTLTLLVSP